MAEQEQKSRSPITLAERFDGYRVAVQQVVERGIEHANYELKRAVTISKENLADRLDFVKLIQGLANAHIAEERFVVIGPTRKSANFIMSGMWMNLTRQKYRRLSPSIWTLHRG